MKNPITSGEYVVRGIDHIDERRGKSGFARSGRNPDQDPYLIHFYRVNFDGTGLVALTAETATIRFSFRPIGKYFIDTYSRVDLPPVARAATGLRR